MWRKRFCSNLRLKTEAKKAVCGITISSGLQFSALFQILCSFYWKPNRKLQSLYSHVFVKQRKQVQRDRTAELLLIKYSFPVSRFIAWVLTPLWIISLVNVKQIILICHLNSVFVVERVISVIFLCEVNRGLHIISACSMKSDLRATEGTVHCRTGLTTPDYTQPKLILHFALNNQHREKNNLPCGQMSVLIFVLLNGEQFRWWKAHGAAPQQHLSPWHSHTIISDQQVPAQTCRDDSSLFKKTFWSITAFEIKDYLHPSTLTFSLSETET